jgi:quinoprotein glucose dehydrogenase
MLTRAMTTSVVLALLGAPYAANAQAIPGAQAESSAAMAEGEWPAYAGTYAAARYSPLRTRSTYEAERRKISAVSGP